MMKTLKTTLLACLLLSTLPTYATSGMTLAAFCNNFNGATTIILQMILIGATVIALISGYKCFVHLRLHYQEPQARHFNKAMVSAVVAVGLLSVTPLLHEIQNTLVDGMQTANDAESWSAPGTQST